MADMNILELKALVKQSRMLKSALILHGRNEKLNIEGLVEEVERLQSIRIANKIDVTESVVDQILNRSAMDQSYRSRISEIQFIAIKLKYVNEKKVEVIKNEISSTFNEEIRQVFRTAQERENFLDSLIRDIKKYIGELEMLNSLCNIIITDIDKAAWGLRLMLDAISQHGQKERYV